MSPKTDALPELLLVDTVDGAQSRRLQRLAAEGTLRRLYAGVYTANLDSPAASVVLRHWRAVVGHLLPGAVISHRSAFDLKPQQGRLIVTRGLKRRRVELPGLVIEVMPGPGPQLTPPGQDMPFGALYLASDPRRFLENLTRGRGAAERVLPQAQVEAQLDRILMVGGEARLNQLRDQARSLAPALALEDASKRLDGLIGALLGTHAARRLSSAQALASAAGRPYDPHRLVLFDTLFEALQSQPLPDVPDPAPVGAAREHFAFFESYFSNYIEGTTFTVDEAEGIVFQGRIIENRSEDAHDVLGTFQAALASPWRDRLPERADAFLDWVCSVNALVMQRRPDMRPGEWKDRANQAGSTLFVSPERVPGTLREGFERIAALRHPLARAVMTMFVVTEVHPFLDGNGRTARLSMNNALSAAGQCRIVIPTVYREDYLLPLKALSQHANAQPLIDSMVRIQRWSAAFDYRRPLNTLRSDLERCHAFQEDLRNYQLIFPQAQRSAAASASQDPPSADNGPGVH